MTITFDITPQAALHSHLKITNRNVRRLGRYNDRNDEHLFLTIFLGALAGDLDAVTITRCEPEPPAVSYDRANPGFEPSHVLAGQLGGSVTIAGDDRRQQRGVLVHVVDDVGQPPQEQAEDPRGQIVVAD